jgi:hypothetical protein
MREKTLGFETRSGAGEGLVTTSGTLDFVSASPTAHKDFAGNGGSYSLQGNNSGTTVWYCYPFESGRFLRHYFMRWYVNLYSGQLLQLYSYNSTTVILSVRISGSTGLITINNQAGTVLATSVGALGLSTWYRINVEVYHATSGFVKVYVDDDAFTTPFVQYSGDTRGTGGVLTTIDRIGSSFGAGAADLGALDDVAVNSITLRYDGGVGTIPSAGQTVEVSGSGARSAVITSVEGTAASGILVLENYSATLLPLADNTAITITASGWTGAVNAPLAVHVNGLEAQSGHPKTGFVFELPPTGAGSVTGLTPSTGSNYACVDERPASTTDYVSDTVDQDYDLYAHGSLPATAAVVVAVVPWAYAQKDGALTKYQLPIKLGATTYVAHGATLGVGTEGQIPLAVSYQANQLNYVEHPDGTSGALTPADINSSENGFRVRT